MTTRARRRGRRSSPRRPLRIWLLAVVLAAVLAIAIGEVAADVVDSAGPASLIEQRSYVAGVVPVIDESTATKAWLTEVRWHAPELGRPGLAVALGRLVAACRQAQQQLAQLGLPPPSARSGHLLEAMLAERTRAARELAISIASALSPAGSNRALGELRLALSEIRRSDSEYRAFVGSLPRRSRSQQTRLPDSSWWHAADWSTTSLERFLATLSSDPSLTTRRRLTIIALGVEPPVLRVTPASPPGGRLPPATTTSTTVAAPPSTAPAGKRSAQSTTTSTTTTTTTLQIPPSYATSWLAPTSRVRTIIVIANAGNVAARNVIVTARVVRLAASGKSRASGQAAGSPSSTPETVRRLVRSCGAGSSLELSLPPLGVRPGNVYMLTVAISGGRTAAAAGDTESVRIAVAS